MTAVAADGTTLRFTCPAGYYCLEGQSSGTTNPCPKGTYNDHVGAWSSNECRPAPPGYYQDLVAATSIDPAKKCDGGWYCKIGSYCKNPWTCI